MPSGRHHRQCLDLLVDMRRAGGVVAARTRGDPAAERRELERLREVTEREAVRLQLLLERGAEHARLDLRGAGALVDLEHAAEPPEVEADSAHEPVADVAVRRRPTTDEPPPYGTTAIRLPVHQSRIAATSCSDSGSATRSGGSGKSRRSARTRSRYDLP